MLSTIILSWIALYGFSRLMMILPITLCIAIVYKATRCDNVRDIPVAAFALWLTILGGMAGVAFAVWLVFQALVVWR